MDTNLLASTIAALSTLVHTNSIRSTNWINTGDSNVKSGTNWIEQYMSEITVTEKVATPTIVWITNPTPVRISRELFSKTNATIANGTMRLIPRQLPPLPIEARMTKE